MTQPPAIDCPKCGERRPPEAGACPRCGLAVDRFAGFSAAAEDDAPAAIAELWNACRETWTDDAAHDRFVKAAMVADAYRFAAAAYRQVLRDRPDDAIAKARLADVARRAESAVLGSAAARHYKDDGKEPYKTVALLLVILLAFIAAGVVYAVFISKSATEKADPGGPAAGVERVPDRPRVRSTKVAPAVKPRRATPPTERGP